MNKENLKRKISKEEMYELFVQESVFTPNKIRVGKFAKSLGYVSAYQKVNGKNVWFYIKATD